jgi:hypothetical protein
MKFCKKEEQEMKQAVWSRTLVAVRESHPDGSAAIAARLKGRPSWK